MSVKQTPATRWRPSLVAFVLATGCADAAKLTAPVLETAANAYDKLETKVANLLGCANSWTGGDGNWTDATKWSTGAVPDATQDVCITAPGAYTVTVTANRFANALTIGAEGAGAQPVLVINGLRPSTTGAPTPALLTVTTDVDNYGTIELRATGFTGTTSQITVGGTLANKAGATTRTVTASGGGREIEATLVNDGTVDLLTNTTLAGHFTNNAAFNIADNATATVSGSGTFIQAAGALSVGTGNFAQSNGDFELRGGAVTGATIPTFTNVDLVIGDDASAAGSFRMRANSTIAGDVHPQVGIIVDGFRPSSTGAPTPAQLTAAAGFSNFGVIQLQATGFTGTTAELHVTDGALTNEPSGTIRVLPGAGGGREINGAVVNDGIVEVSTDLTLATHFTNNATFNIAEGIAVTVSGNETFIQAAGTLSVGTGSFAQSNGAFELNGGSISGQSIPTLTNMSVVVGNDASVTGSLRMRANSTITGDIHPGVAVIVDGFRPSSTGAPTPATLTATTSFTNAGVIQIQATGFTGTTAELHMAPGQTLTNNGTIRSLAAAGGGREISGFTINNGTVDISTLTTLAGVHTNNALFSVSDPGAVTVAGNSTFRQNGGSLTLSGAFNQSNGAFELNGGAIAGASTPTLTNVDLSIGPAATTMGTLRMRANSTLHGNVPAGVGVIVDGFRPSSTGAPTPARLLLPGSITNTGTIQLQATGFTGTTATLEITEPNTLTNTGMLRVIAGNGGGRTITGNVTNAGTLEIGTPTTYQNATMRQVAPGMTMGGARLTIAGNANFFGVGNVGADILNQGHFHVGASPGLLNITGDYTQSSAGDLNIEVGGSVPGTDFDRLNISGVLDVLGILNVVVRAGSCVDGGSSFQFMAYGSRVTTRDFTAKVGVNLGAGRTLTATPSSTVYTATINGPPCVAPDVTPPVIVPNIAGTLGDNGWYVSDVTVTFSVTDPESAISSSSGCGEAQVIDDTSALNIVCSATSAGGTSQLHVQIKRDATPPVVQAVRSPAANAFGWNNGDVTATYTATDALSGLVGDASATQIFSDEGADQSGSRIFTDRAGNSATASIAAISIDKTAPVPAGDVSPALPSSRWYNVDVTATLSATDALSGIDGSASVSRVFSQDGVGQEFFHTFSDRAGNSASTGIDGINVDKTPPVVTATRSPAPGPDGFNDTDVTATFTATDALSGISGAATASVVFSNEGTNQSASRGFSDLAGNSATGTITGINIRKTPPPPPPGVSCSVTPSRIWPPNGKMVEVKVAITGAVRFRLKSVKSEDLDDHKKKHHDRGDRRDNKGKNDDDDDDDKHSDCHRNDDHDDRDDRDDHDWRKGRHNDHDRDDDIKGFRIGTADLEGRLRAEKGQIYTLVYRTVDASGKRGTCTVTVIVPHDQKKKSK